MDYPATKEIIAKSNFLIESDAQFIDDNISDIESNWKKRQIFRTETEMRISVLNDGKFPTPASKYWQCVREQSVFYEQLVQLSFDFRKIIIEQKKLKLKIAKELDDLDLELLEIGLEESQFRQLNMKQTADDRMREIRLWSALMKELTEAANFDSDDVNAHQLVSYAHRFEFQMKNIEGGSPAEVNNLLGQYQTTMAVLEKKQKLKAIKNNSDELGFKY